MAMKNAKDMTFVKRVRKRSGKTQEAFAAEYGIPVGTLRAWERGRYGLTSSSRGLLQAIERELKAAE